MLISDLTALGFASSIYLLCFRNFVYDKQTEGIIVHITINDDRFEYSFWLIRSASFELRLDISQCRMASHLQYLNFAAFTLFIQNLTGEWYFMLIHYFTIVSFSLFLVFILCALCVIVQKCAIA